MDRNPSLLFSPGAMFCALPCDPVDPCAARLLGWRPRWQRWQQMKSRSGDRLALVTHDLAKVPLKFRCWRHMLVHRFREVCKWETLQTTWILHKSIMMNIMKNHKKEHISSPAGCETFYSPGASSHSSSGCTRRSICKPSELRRDWESWNFDSKPILPHKNAIKYQHYGRLRIHHGIKADSDP